jgi:hypothetical protein
MCGGWGYVDAIGMGRSTLNISSNLIVKDKKKRPRLDCPYCDWQGSKLARHIRIHHQDVKK